MKAKNGIWLSPIRVLGLVLILMVSCKKDEGNNNPSGSITDKDGNVYTSVTIGNQVWMVENLKTTKYNDGTDIPLVTDNAEWKNLTTPGYCWYDNDASTYKSTYGALYNWYAVNTNKLCPTGWRVPTSAEWTILTDYMGGLDVAGGRLKETGLTHWIDPNTGATNEYGFNALPAGARDLNGLFGGIGSFGNWWSSLETEPTYAAGRGLHYFDGVVGEYGYPKISGISVRCVKD